MSTSVKFYRNHRVKKRLRSHSWTIVPRTTPCFTKIGQRLLAKVGVYIQTDRQTDRHTTGTCNNQQTETNHDLVGRCNQKNITKTVNRELSVNTLIATLKPQSNGPSYSNTVIGTLAVDGWAVTVDTARRGLGGAGARPDPSSLYQM